MSITIGTYVFQKIEIETCTNCPCVTIDRNAEIFCSLLFMLGGEEEVLEDDVSSKRVPIKCPLQKIGTFQVDENGEVIEESVQVTHGLDGKSGVGGSGLN